MNFVRELYKRISPEQISDSDVSLNNVLETTINDIINPSSKQNNNADRNLYEDFDYFDRFKKRQKNRKTLLNALLKINPTSTFSERVFSTPSFIKTKQKSRLKSEHLICIRFLKYYFKREDAKTI